MKAGVTNVLQLLGALFEAHWQRAIHSPQGWLVEMYAVPYKPKSAEEHEIWNELTAPHNHVFLWKLIELRAAQGINEEAAQFDNRLLSESERIWREACQGKENETSITCAMECEDREAAFTLDDLRWAPGT